MARLFMLITGLLLLLFIFVARSPETKAQEAIAGLVINEVFDSQTPANEFFELYNGTSADINLSNYVIFNQNGSDSLSALNPPIIRANQFLAVPASTFPDRTIGGPTGLTNNGDFLALVATGVSDTVVDVVNWGQVNPNWPNYQRFSTFFFSDTPPIMPPADQPRDLQRWPDGFDTNRGSDWAQIERSPGTASCADPYEPDNAPNTNSATALTSGQLHRICPGGNVADVDFFQITLSTAFSYTIETYDLGAQLDTQIALVQSDGTEVAVGVDVAEPRGDRIVFRPATSGTYFLRVSDVLGRGERGPGFLYRVRFSATAAATVTPTGSPAATATPTPFCNDNYEPDNDRAQAKALNLGTDQRRTICSTAGAGLADEDWIVLAAAPGKIYTIFTRDLGPGLDTEIYVFDADGELLAYNDDKATRCNLCSEVNLAFPDVSTYYLLVRDNRGQGGLGWTYTVSFTSQGTPPNTAVPTPTRTVDPNAPTITPTPGRCPDPYEHDGVPETAKLLLIGQIQPGHNFCPDGDADWYRFFGAVGKAYTIRTASLGIGVDTYLFLFDSNGRDMIAQNDDGPGEAVTSVLDFFPLRDAFYYIMVKNKGDLGAPFMSYDVTLAVRANTGNVPVGSPTSLIAPVVTSPAATATSQAAAPTRTTAPATATAPAGGNPTSTATRTPSPGPGTPTRTPVPTPVGTVAAVIPPPAGGLTGGIEPSATPVVEVAAADPSATPEPFVPLPAAGFEAPAPAPGSAPDFVSMPVLVYFDANRDGRFNPGEEVRDLTLRFLDKASRQTTEAVTGSRGTVAARLVRNSDTRVYIPYLKWSGDVVAGADGFAIRIPGVALPARIP